MNDDLDNDYNNLITLCKTCHKKVKFHELEYKDIFLTLLYYSELT
jgi:5-methylcytosine-specific restriction endonuclease McrA